MTAVAISLGCAQVDDASAEFGALYDAHHRKVYRLALLLTGSPAAAEDAVAEAFARTWPKWRAGQVRDPAAYLRRAVVNQVNGGFRKLFYERREEARRRADDRGQRGVDEHAADADRLARALATLPPRQRAAVVLRYYEDLSEDATAAALGTSVGTVKSSVSRGLTRLRAVLEAAEAEAS